MSNDPTQIPPSPADPLPSMSIGTAVPVRHLPSDQPVTPPTVDGYAVLDVCGEGAMGTVWRAIQLGTRRRVALKLMRSHVFASEKARMRFDREVELTARLDHQNIARVYDSGVHQGVFYYAMELVEGVPLDVYVEQHKLTQRQIIELFKVICEALEHAHLRGVIHRDLKPSNILVDSAGNPHVLDFGLAKAVLEETRMHEVSLDGDIAGTPAYMSPEQAAGRTQTLDTRTDVFSLGVILYRLLCGAPPHDPRGSHQQLMQRIIDQDAIRPRAVCPEIDRELEALLLKALAREREQRYATAGGMAADIDNYLRGEPLAARAPTTAYFLRKRLRRHRVPLGIAAGVLLALLGMAVFAYIQIAQERNAAIAAHKVAEEQRHRAEQETRAAVQARGDSLIRLGDMYAARGDMTQALEQYQGAFRTLAPLGGSRRAEVGIFDMMRQSPPPLATWAIAANGATDLAMHADNRTAILSSSDGSIRLFDLVTGVEVRRLAGHESMVTSVAAASGIILTGGADGTMRTWTADGQALRVIDAGGAWVRHVAICPDGRLGLGVIGGSVVLLDDGGDTLVLVDLDNGRELFRQPAGDEVSQVAISPDRRLFVAAGTRTAVYSTDDGRLIGTNSGHSGSITAARFSLDSRQVLTAGTDRSLRLFDVNTADSGTIIFEGTRPFIAADFVPGAQAVVAMTDDHAALRLDLQTHQVTRFAPPADGSAHAATVSSDGSMLVGLSLEDKLTMWDLGTPPETQLMSSAGQPVRSLGVLRDMPVVIGHVGSEIMAWDMETGRRLFLTDLDRPADALALADNGRALAIAHGNRIARYDLNRRQWEEITQELAAPATTLALSPNAQVIAAGLADGRLVVHDLHAGTQHELLPADPRHLVRSMAFSQDSGHLAAGGADRIVRVWDLATGHLAARHSAHGDGVNCIAVGDDGRWVASGSGNLPWPGRRHDYSVRLWNTADPEEPMQFRGHDGRVRGVAFIEQAGWVASVGDDGMLRLWDATQSARGDRAIRAMRGGGESIACIAVSDDGLRLVTGNDAGRLVRWDLAAPARQLALQPAVLAFQADPTAQRDGKSLELLAEWYALRGRAAWASEVYERVREQGAVVADVRLARLYWQAGNGRLAAEAYSRAAATADGSGQRYLQLCRDSAAAAGDDGH